MVELGLSGKTLVVRREGSWESVEWTHNNFCGGYATHDESDIHPISQFEIEVTDQGGSVRFKEGEIVGHIGPRLIRELQAAAPHRERKLKNPFGFEYSILEFGAA